MKIRSPLESMFKKHEFTDYKWINPNDIVVSHWVRMKCMWGCNEYGRNACCPPNVPSIEDCALFFKEYNEAAIFHFVKVVNKPEDRFPWTKKIDTRLLQLERDVFISGFPKAFLLFLDSCNLCRNCAESKFQCKHPEQSRPTPEALGVDVFATVKKVGYPVEVLSDYTQMMNRYAFLMII